ncbi:MAG: restriction endonuclease subunit S, partial [Bacteroidales bacterium]|nr:restriction endonuclease subunit S [Bacteroidales bacterium]
MKQNWEIKKLGDVCDFIGDGDWIESADQSSYGIRLLQTGNIGNGIFLNKDNKAHYISEETFNRLRCTEVLVGDCLVSRLPEPIGRACLVPATTDKMITAVDCTILRFNKCIQPEYFVYYSQCNKYYSDIELMATGATRKRISRKNLTNIPIPLPPLADQRRIVSILDEKFSQIETLKSNAQKNLDNAEQLWKAQLETQFDNQKWEKKKLGEVAKVSSSKRIYADELSPSGVPFLRVSDVVSRINGTETCDLYIPEEKYLSFFDKGLVPKENDVLVTSRGTLGLCYIIKSTDRFYFQDGMITWLALKNDINPKFIYYLFDSQIIKKQIATKAAGAAVSYISITDIKNFEIPIPSLAEQERIVKELD